MKKLKKSKKAMTLLEVMIVIFIIGIISSVIGYNMKGSLEKAKAFKTEIHKIQGEEIDVAFFPVDSRLEEFYYLGGNYFIETLSPKLFIPMHFGDNVKVTQDFAEFKKRCYHSYFSAQRTLNCFFR